MRTAFAPSSNLKTDNDRKQRAIDDLKARLRRPEIVVKAIAAEKQDGEPARGVTRKRQTQSLATRGLSKSERVMVGRNPLQSTRETASSCRLSAGSDAGPRPA